MDILLSIVQTLAQISTAGIAITAFSLLIYALTFNLRDRVARSFALILACVTAVFTGEAISSVATSLAQAEFWLRFQWIGLLFLPATYLHFSDALLATTGRPSRGRRRMLIRLVYVLSGIFLLTLPFDFLVGNLIFDMGGIFHFERARFTWLFVFFYMAGVVWAWANFWRAYRRTVTATSLRRMRYLLAGAIAPAWGSFPYLLFGAGFASLHPLVFWLVVLVSNVVIFGLLILMAYAVAFFGVSWPDRVVIRRLAKWLMRGPGTAFVVLGLTTIIRRTEQTLGLPDTAAVPIVMVAAILIMEHLITISAPVWERWSFNARDRSDLRLLQALEERLLTTRDLVQFLEAVLAAACDQLQVSTAFVAAIGGQGIELLVTTGNGEPLRGEDLSRNILQIVSTRDGREEIFSWGDYWLLPLYGAEEDALLGVMGVGRSASLAIEQREAILALGARAALALEDRRMQQDVFASLESLTPQVELIQRLRAASRYDRDGVLTSPDDLPASVDLSRAVKDAFSHYWGGPKLSQSPLMRLKVVQNAIDEHQGNPVNALRATLREALERIRPEGERRFTGEWILYNILELKFLQGRKVREVALRLAMSEADLYRKQRVAIEAVAQAILDMERQAREDELQEFAAENTPESEIELLSSQR